MEQLAILGATQAATLDTELSDHWTTRTSLDTVAY